MAIPCPNTYPATYAIQGRVFPVKCYAVTPQTGPVPILDVPMLSDLKWNKMCLQSRLEHPEHYAATEDVGAVIADLRQLIAKMEQAQ